MPNPKRRHSKRRTALRRSHDFLTAGSLSICPNCQEKKLPHRACAKCGEYKGRAVLETKEAASFNRFFQRGHSLKRPQTEIRAGHTSGCTPRGEMP